MRVVFHVLFIFLYSLFDIFLTFFGITLYSSKWSINFENIWKTLNIFNYSYWTSPLDFIILVCFRQIVLLITFIIVRYGKSEKLKKHILFVDIAAVLSYMISTIKILAFDETSGFLGDSPGAFINVGSSIVFSILLCGLVRISILSSQFNYRRLEEEDQTEENSINDSDEDEESRSGLSKEERANRVPFWKHIFLIIKICSKQWKWFIASYIFLIISCAANLIQPAINTQMLIDAITMQSFDLLKKSCLLLIAVDLSTIIVDTIKYIFQSYANTQTSIQVRLALFKAIIHQDISFFDENSTGQLMSRMDSDTNSISHSIPICLETLTMNIIHFVGILPIIVSYSWQLSLTAFITFPISFIVSQLYGKYSVDLYDEESDMNADTTDIVQNVLSAIRTVRSFATEKIEFQRYTKHINEWFKFDMKSSVLHSIFSLLWRLMYNMESVLVYLYGGYLTINGRMDSKNLLVYVAYHSKLTQSLDTFTEIYSEVLQIIGSSRKVIYLLNRKPILDYENGSETPEVLGTIVFDGVEFAYPTRKNVEVLKSLNLTIEKGKTVALVGPSGNGKTTIVSLIEQFYAPKSGQILLDGTNIQNIQHEYYHSKVALVAQEPTLFSGSIRDNILYGYENGSEEEMLKVAKMANVHEFVEKLEKGYDTKCGEKGIQMSGGQKQRIAIARALIRNPAILILDEATSALDSESESLVQDALNCCAKNRTVIIIAHRLSTVKNADKIAVIEKGQVTEIGTHFDLMKNIDGMYYKLVSKQLEPKKEEQKNDDDIF